MPTLRDPQAWPTIAAAFDRDAASGGRIGLILLATDRASSADVRAFLPAGAAVFETRVPMATVATAESLRAMRDHLSAAASVLVPGGPLDAIGFCCTSGSVAIGADQVTTLIGRGRPGVPVTNPVDAAVRAFAALRLRRVALLVPYLAGPAALIEQHLSRQAITISTKATFNLDGDPEMNRVTAACLIDAAWTLASSAATDGVFISCTGLRTREVIEPVEQRLGLPVVTSNQALAWDLARTAGLTEPLTGRGRLFREH
jgi:maleate isomerase